MKNDVILIRGLRVKTRIGVTDEERAEPREVSVDLDIETDLAAAGASDELADTIDYSRIITAVTSLLADGEFRLLEHAAEEIADLVTPDAGVHSVTVEISKEPPVAEEVGEVGVRMTRPRR